MRKHTAQEQEKLIDLALEARNASYSPYSNFRVGAALLAEDGTFFKGCNVENASYGGAICAERTAYVKAISEGYKSFIGLAVATDLTDDFCSPCGICRQFISEFGPKDLPVYLCKPDRTFFATSINWKRTLDRTKQKLLHKSEHYGMSKR
ncbi:hypothetical protein BZG36_05178 [Bifiguratus adelaidae]|uniref:Cytidine deaminase n=1 Tax=Bifiguratus adelaidae TaxID=1938954 RepID=A0A261XTP0_9FUNG|nr:hypothetical protein BZG36_05178 [Bifiguratus adelaidae]